jgi:hypothetical protein
VRRLQAVQKLLLPRLFVAAFASIAVRYPVFLFLHNTFFLQDKRLTRSFSELCRWDCPNYAELTLQLKPSAFFPLLPLFSKIGVFFGLLAESSLIVTSTFFALLSGVLTLYLFDAFQERFKDVFSNLPSEKIAGFSLVAWSGFLVLSFFPQSHFWVRGYSEPLFWFFFSAWGYCRLKESRFAFLFLSMLPLTRPQGVWIFGLILFFEFLDRFRSNRFQLQEFKSILLLFLSLIPFLGFLFWNFFMTKNPLFFVQAQSGWARAFDWKRGWIAHYPRFLDASLYILLGWASVFYFWSLSRLPSMLRLGLTLGSLVLTEFPLWFGGLYSYNRFSSIHFGIFWFLAVFFSRRKFWFALWFLWSFSRLSVYTHRAGFGHWVESQGTPYTEINDFDRRSFF